MKLKEQEDVLLDFQHLGVVVLVSFGHSRSEQHFNLQCLRGDNDEAEGSHDEVFLLERHVLVVFVHKGSRIREGLVLQLEFLALATQPSVEVYTVA